MMDERSILISKICSVLLFRYNYLEVKTEDIEFEAEKEYTEVKSEDMEEKQIKRCYLIDYENVNQAGLNGIESLTENDELMIFYTGSSRSISFEMTQKFMSCAAKVKFIIAETISYYYFIASALGFAIGSEPEKEYFVISNSSEVKAMEEYWANNDVKIHTSQSISGKKQPEQIVQNNEQTEPSDALIQFAQNALEKTQSEQYVLPELLPAKEKFMKKIGDLSINEIKKEKIWNTIYVAYNEPMEKSMKNRGLYENIKGYLNTFCASEQTNYYIKRIYKALNTQ